MTKQYWVHTSISLIEYISSLRNVLDHRIISIGNFYGKK